MSFLGSCPKMIVSQPSPTFLSCRLRRQPIKLPVTTLWRKITKVCTLGFTGRAYPFAMETSSCEHALLHTSQRSYTRQCSHLAKRMLHNLKICYIWSKEEHDKINGESGSYAGESKNYYYLAFILFLFIPFKYIIRQVWWYILKKLRQEGHQHLVKGHLQWVLQLLSVSPSKIF